LTNKNHIPVTQLNYGGSDSRYSWIFYELGSLECSGKEAYAIYPSELYEYRINNIENDIDQLEWKTTENTNDIVQLKSRTTKLETDAAAPDYYFKHGCSS